MAWNKSRAAHDTTSVLSGTRVSVWHSSLSPSGNNSAFEFVLATTVDCCGHKMRRMVKRFIPQNARDGEEVVGAGRARPSPAPGVLTGSRGGSKTRTGMNKNANDGSGVWRTYGAWGLGLGTLSQPLQAGLKLCRTSGAREEEDGAVLAWTQYAPVSARALMMWSSGNPRPPRSFVLGEKRQDVLFFLALPWVRNVECALGLGGFLAAP